MAHPKKSSYDSREIHMNKIVFDTLQFAKRAEKAGFTKQQAEFQAEEMATIIENDLATKRDLEYWANKLTIRFGGMLAIAIGILTALIKLGH